MVDIDEELEIKKVFIRKLTEQWVSEWGIDEGFFIGCVIPVAPEDFAVVMETNVLNESLVIVLQILLNRALTEIEEEEGNTRH